MCVLWTLAAMIHLMAPVSGVTSHPTAGWWIASAWSRDDRCEYWWVWRQRNSWTEESLLLSLALSHQWRLECAQRVKIRTVTSTVAAWVGLDRSQGATPATTRPPPKSPSLCERWTGVGGRWTNFSTRVSATKLHISKCVDRKNRWRITTTTKTNK